MINKDLVDFSTKTRDSKIKVSEHGKQAIILNDNRDIYYVIKVDGGLLKNKLASDYVISKLKVGDLVIELKGMDVNHAVEQVMASAQHWQDNGYRNGGIAALIVCSRKPSIDTKIQKFIVAFGKRFKGPLHVVPRNDEFLFERVLQFAGPK